MARILLLHHPGGTLGGMAPVVVDPALPEDAGSELLPRKVATAVEVCGDLVWLAFNIYFVYLSYDFVFNKMNLFWKSQTTGVPMKYIYIILPLSFALMSIRIIQVNYYKLVKGIDVLDPEAVEREHIMEHEAGHKTDVEKMLEAESKKQPNA